MDTNGMLDDGTGGLTRAIIGAAMSVSTTLGHGFLEAVYRRALIHELRQRNIAAEEEVTFPVTYKGVNVGNFIADLIAERQVVIELKAVECLNPAHRAQVLNYLKASGLNVGLLLNFGTPRLEYRRVLA